MDLEKIKKMLEEEKTEIESLLESYEEESQEILKETVSSSDDIDNRYEFKQEIYLKKEILEKRLEKINKALEKIEKGNYGICEKCLNPIEPERLKIDLAVTTCKKCSLR
jgi:DnaK suppressor protein